MDTKVDEKQELSMGQSGEEGDKPNTNSSSEKLESSNGIEDNGKSVEDSLETPLNVDNIAGLAVPVAEDSGFPSDGTIGSDGQSNEQLDNHLDSDAAGLAYVGETAKDNNTSNGDGHGNGDRGTTFNAVDGSGEAISPSNLTAEYDIDRILIDTAAPFESVKEAVSKFGGIVDWKAHTVQCVERRKIIERELAKVQQEIPQYKKQSEMAEKSKNQLLNDLENIKRLVEELKLNLERAQTEERQAKQDSELVQLRVEELEQGIAQEASVAAKQQVEVAKARHSAAIADIKSVKEELQSLQKERASLVTEKESAEKKADEAVRKSKEIEKTVEELTIELITTKEALESAHAAHHEAEERRVGAAMAKEQDTLSWDKDLKETEEELKQLNRKIESAKELESKLHSASTLLTDLKAELAAYMESKISEGTDDSDDSSDLVNKPNGALRAVVAAANKELQEVKLNVERATEEVNCLKGEATSLKAEIEKQKLELSNLRQREGIASMAVATLEGDLKKFNSEIALVQWREKEAREKLEELPKQLQHTSREAHFAKQAVALAREELKKAKEDVEQAKAGVNTMENRLLAARKEIEASKAAESLALSAIKALQESESSKPGEDDSTTGITLSLEEYYQLSKRAHEAEEQAKTKISTAMSQIEVAKESKVRSLAQLKEATRELEERKESLRIALEKAEKAQEGKLGVEHELRKWRAEHELRRKSSESGHGTGNSPSKSNGVDTMDSSSSVKYGQQGLGLKQIANANGSTTPDSESPKEGDAKSPRGFFGLSNTFKKKRKNFFPRFFMFFTKKKSSHNKTS